MRNPKRNRQLHSKAVEYLLEAVEVVCREAGIETKIEIAPSPSLQHDFTVNGLRVTVRVATLGLSRHTVCAKGKRYSYKYPKLHYNLHVHRKRVETDIIICVRDTAKNGKFSLKDFFVFPQEVYPAKTFSFHVGSKEYAGKLSPYHNNWRGLLEALNKNTGRDEKLKSAS